MARPHLKIYWNGRVLTSEQLAEALGIPTYLVLQRLRAITHRRREVGFPTDFRAVSLSPKEAEYVASPIRSRAQAGHLGGRSLRGIDYVARRTD